SYRRFRAPQRLPRFPTRRSSDLAGAPLGALRELREGAPVVVVMHRVAGAPDDAPPGEEVPHGLSRYLHVVESVVLSEDVTPAGRSEEHTSELQSRENLVCRLPLE